MEIDLYWEGKERCEDIERVFKQGKGCFGEWKGACVLRKEKEHYRKGKGMGMAKGNCWELKMGRGEYRGVCEGKEEGEDGI